MQIVQKLAGFSLGRADIVRKAMGKKKQDVMDAEKEVFIYGNQKAFDAGIDEKLVPGCINRGISEEVASEIWAKMENFAKYAFNRSHAACYAYIAYLTAYMSCHWAEEFYCGMFNAFIDNNDKLKGYLNQANHRGIKLLPPDINKSTENFSVEQCDDGTFAIRFGLKGLMGLGKVSADIIRSRKTAPFRSYHEFYTRCKKAGVKLNKIAMNSLIFAGALDCFGITKKRMVVGLKQLDDVSKNDKKNCEGQMTLFDQGSVYDETDFVDNTFGVPDDEAEYHKRLLMEKEKGAIGFYLSEHPMDELNVFIKQLDGKNYFDISNLVTFNESKRDVKTCGIVKNTRQIFTKKGTEMYTFELEDKFNSIKCVVFSDAVDAIKPILREDKILYVSGNYQPDPNWGNQIIVSTAIPEEKIGSRNASDCIFVEVEDKEGQDFLIEMIQKHPGKVKVFMRAKGKTKLYAMEKKYGNINLTPHVLDALQMMFHVKFTN